MTAKPAEPRTVPVGALEEAFATRARAYAHIFDVLRENFGAARAVELLAEATHRMGAASAGPLAAFAPADLAGLSKAFLGAIPVADVLFSPEVLREDTGHLDIEFHSCPLVRTWKQMGRGDEDIEQLCQGARAVDHGMFTAAGFAFTAEGWKRDGHDRCRMQITPGQSGG
ncbi:L-2-amino-thiazoline-4-carboxylic acid hydrolase [Telmatospirillum sp.]|uniref:L-2-amino-thiazoline-4-carboxylic acid hydrolase n=1 Tax=Telmatospirillum sp. TaxID=2079197 RepID=UPI00283FBF76|nr:L-2-amino-thiazoline-4-carboxylic acid hydrolase [Telmatospirillum sp.]MDR3437230.1 L-2-amino-thiazoline-4-carboxylic acid hydrolase [Telmatospirillum sp.]